MHITSNLRGILNAWHSCFYFKFSVYGTMPWVGLGGGVVHPLIGRYIFLSSAIKRIHDERG
ncbi:DUF3265 domain-containing protein [Vibrio sp. B1-2]|nr:DUF3265 domain-containing protein [Vibrio sp. B1-2]